MAVRHITCVDNVDEDGYRRDEALVHHGSLGGGVVAALGGPVDLLTHANHDFPDHETGECVVVEKLEVGAAIVRDGEGLFARSRPRPGAKQRRGRVDVGARRIEWLNKFKETR